MVQDSKSSFSPLAFKNYIIAIRPWSYKLQQADQRLSPGAMLNLRSGTLKITSSKVFLIPLKIWSLILKATYEPLCELEYQTSTWIYLTSYAFLFTGQLSGIFLRKPFSAENIETEIALGSHLFCDFQFSLCSKKENILISSILQFHQVLKLTFFYY